MMHFFSLDFSGGVAGISNYPKDLDYIEVVHGGHAILHDSGTDIDGRTVGITEFKGDESGAFYVSNDVSVQVTDAIAVS